MGSLSRLGDDSKISLKSITARKAKDEKNKKCRWFSILLSWFTIFATMSQFSMFSGILGPYLSILDPSISNDFAPWTVMAYSFSQMPTAPLFGYWSNRIKKCRPPIVTGLGIIIIGTVAFLCLEMFPVHSRKWAMLAIRVFIGFGSRSLCVSRSYCATASTITERSKAVAGSTAAVGLAVIVGPGAQGLFALVSYPGIYINTFHLHMYNAPALASVIFLFILIILNLTLLLEEYPGVEKDMKKTSETVSAVRPLPQYDKFAVFLLIWCWFCSWTLLTTFVVLGIPFTQAQFDWSLSDALLYNGGVFGAFAGMSLIVYLTYAYYGSRIDDKIPTILGMLLMFGFWLLTFPCPGYPVPAVNNYETNATSNSTLICKYTSQPWCLYTSRIPMVLYFTSFTLLAAGFPICSSALSALLPKIIGPRRMVWITDKTLKTT